MALSLSLAVQSYAPATLSLASRTRTSTCVMETVADVKALAEKCNPKIGFYDPLGLIDQADTGEQGAATIGWLRHAEIKHGRVAMAAFVGFCVQSNGIYFPWDLANGVSHASISAAGGPGDQWDALPTAAKLQILGFIGFLEMVSETSFFLGEAGETHYVRGGKPGFYPPFSKLSLPHPVPLDLWDPFGFTKKMSPERKAKALVAEINNGRLAQIGIFGMISASKGLYVPGLDSIEGIKPYAGEYMAPFSELDSGLWMVPEMLALPLKFGNLIPGVNDYM